jgi:hypothetical protein
LTIPDDAGIGEEPQSMEKALGVEPSTVIAGSDDQGVGHIGADAEPFTKLRDDPQSEGIELLLQVGDFLVECVVPAAHRPQSPLGRRRRVAHPLDAVGGAGRHQAGRGKMAQLLPDGVWGA